MPKPTWNYAPFWQEAVTRMQQELPEQEYAIWFSRIQYTDSEEQKLILSVPSQFILDYVAEKYLHPLQSLLTELTGEPIVISFTVKTPAKNAKPPQEPPQSTSNKEKATQSKTTPEAVQKPVRKGQQDTNLNPLYQFSSFVIGTNSDFAYNAAMAIAKNPGVSYNPCLIYGGVGLGKTHLIQSIGNYIQTHTPILKTVYVTAEEFTNEFIQSIPNNKITQFKNKYRKVDVLLIDDIHFLQGKESTQEELFHTFNSLYETNKQMVFTCDRPISELKELTARLRSRFERGLNVDLQPPDYETRMAILKKKCEEQHCFMSDEVLDYISKSVNTNVRDLEASLTRLIAYSDLLKKEITLDIAKEQLKYSFALNKEQSLSIDVIIRVVATHYGISPYELKGKKKTKSVVQPRQIAMYIARDVTDFSTTEIGYEFGGRDHTTVMHAVQRVEGLIKTDKALTTTIEKLEREIISSRKG